MTSLDFTYRKSLQFPRSEFCCDCIYKDIKIPLKIADEYREFEQSWAEANI